MQTPPEGGAGGWSPGASPRGSSREWPLAICTSTVVLLSGVSHDACNENFRAMRNSVT